MTRLRSCDAWVLTQPSRAFAHMTSAPAHDGIWLAVRRPLFVAVVLGSVVSLLTANSLTLRIVGPAAACWSFVPVVEVLALLVVVGGSARPIARSKAIDIFFAGHGPWTLLLIGIGAMFAFVPLPLSWTLLIDVGLPAMALVIAWSIYIDVCYFRTVLGRGRAAAAWRVTAFRLLTWTVVITIFAVPSMTPWGLVQEMAEAVKEVLTR